MQPPLRRTSPISSPGIWNRVEYRAARRVRLRGDAVQLHLDRRQPADRARADGQHGAVEAGFDVGAVELVTSRRSSRPRACRPASSTSSPARRARWATRCSRTRDFAGIHFTGSTAGVPEHVEDDRRQHRQLPAPIRASSARPAARTSSSRTRRRTCRRCVTALVRGAFEYQGQKCSAGSRAYIPNSLWPAVRERLAGAARLEREDGLAAGLPQLHLPRSSTSRRSIGSRTTSTTRRTRAKPRSIAGGNVRRLDGLLHRADGRRDHRPEVQADERGDLRPGA